MQDPLFPLQCIMGLYTCPLDAMLKLKFDYGEKRQWLNSVTLDQALIPFWDYKEKKENIENKD